LRFKEKLVPEVAIRLWRNQIDRASDADVIKCSASYRSMSAGFRTGKVPGSHLKAQLLKMLDTKGEIPAPLLDAVRRVGLTDSIVKVLSFDAIRLIHAELAKFYGNSIYVAMLIDDREEVRSLGDLFLAELGPDEPSQANRRVAAKEVLDKLEPFHRIFSEIIDTAIENEVHVSSYSSSTVTPDQELVPRLKSEQTRLEKELKRAVANRERLSIQLTELSYKLDKSELSRKSLAFGVQELQNQLSALSSSFEQRVAAEVTRITDERILPWLPAMERLEAFGTSRESQSIEEQAKQALELQTADDKIYKTKSDVRRTLKRFKELRDEISDALVDALRPRKDLRRVLTALDLEIERLASAVKDQSETTVSNECAELLQRVNSAESLDDLAMIRKDKEQLASEGKLGLSDARILSARIHTKSDLVYRGYFREAPLSELNSNLRALPATLFRMRISRGLTVRLVIDGHNVLFTLADMFKVFFESDVPAKKARDELAIRIENIAQKFPALTVDLWFDSPTFGRETVSKQLCIFYSGGRGANRADDQIVAALKALVSLNEQTVFLVSNDRELADRSEANGASVISCDEFLGFLE